MSLSLFLLWLVSIPFAVHAQPAQVHPSATGYSINCGATDVMNLDEIKWINDDGYINVGSKATLNTPDLMPFLTTLRFFPDKNARKYCYEIPVIRKNKYTVRTTYFYGDFDGGKVPPVFDQIIDGTTWNIVNTTEDYANGLSSYYEIIVQARTGLLSVCLARNEYTTSCPFISALEIWNLDKSMYNSTDFEDYALSTIARHSFGYNDTLIRFPDDQFNRYWQPFTDSNPIVMSKTPVNATNFWNLPPPKVFETGLTTSRGKTLELQWPQAALPNCNYYIALYFQDNRQASSNSLRKFEAFVNGKSFHNVFNVSTSGVTVFAKEWPLSGKTKITLVPDKNATVGPVINAGEIMQVVRLNKTTQRDVRAMEKIARSLKNPPLDWRGDPCLPMGHSWTGITCSHEKFAAVTSVNLTCFGLSGELSPSINRLVQLRCLLLGGNKLTGPIPDMSRLKQLVSLHLEDNQFTGKIPASLGNLPHLKELVIQNNKLEGAMPDSLKHKKGLIIRNTPKKASSK